MVPKESKACCAANMAVCPLRSTRKCASKCHRRRQGHHPPSRRRYSARNWISTAKRSRDYYQQEEDVLSYALFPQVATKFFQYRQAKQLGVDSTMLNKEEKVMPV